MAQQPDQFFPPGMQAGFGGYGDNMGGHLSYGNQYFPTLDSSSVPFNMNPFDSEFCQNNRNSLQPSKTGRTYNTSLKAEIMKRASVALRPYDQFKYANKLGSPAKKRAGQWISS